MPPKISRFAQSVPGSTVVAMRRQADELEAEGVKIIDFGIGEPDFTVPDVVAEAAIQAVRDGRSDYTDPAGLPALRAAIANFEAQQHGTSVSPDQITVTNGSYGALTAIMRGILEPDDEAIVIAPGWGPCRQMIRLCGSVPIEVAMSAVDGRFVIDARKIAAAVSGRTKAIFLNSPWNPTGRVLTEDELSAIAEIAIREDLWIVADEVYSELVFDGSQHISIASLGSEVAERTFIASSLSKSFAMTGWRLGYSIAPLELAPVLNKINHTTTRCAASIVQYAALAAFENAMPDVTAMREEYAARGRMVARGLNQIEGVRCPIPEGTFYALAQIPEEWGPSAAVAEALLMQSGVIVTPGSYYGPTCEHFLRLSFATSMTVIEEGLAELRKVLPLG